MADAKNPGPGGSGNGADSAASRAKQQPRGSENAPHAAAAVRELLERRGCPSEVVAGGFEGLIAQWESVADALDRGYPLDTLDDYLNDMDARQLIEDAMNAVPGALAALAARLATADRRVRAHLIPLATCLWGDRIAANRGWDADSEWWYFMRPARPGPGLKRDLGE
ncbi:MAG: hypothetical protein HYR73_00475 [Candidatus Eisenbacteria bacterium]|nr:hypothetical protein [Candidatus Eisenbacteria bacterium]